MKISYLCIALCFWSKTTAAFSPAKFPATRQQRMTTPTTTGTTSTTIRSMPTEDEEDDGYANNRVLLSDRRSVVSTILGLGVVAAGGVTTPWSTAHAASSASKATTTTTKKNKKVGRPRTFFKGKVTLQDDAQATLGGYKAVFVTARPKNPANIPPEVVRSARGGVPAVFFAVVPNPSVFPVPFALTENDITPEGDFGLTSDPYWWSEDVEWEISARVDTDGAVRTLDATDLVGRTVTSQPGEASPDTEVRVAVKERGFFGSYNERKQS